MRQKKALIIENDAIIRECIEVMYEAEGLAVISAHDGQTGLGAKCGPVQEFDIRTSERPWLSTSPIATVDDSQSERAACPRDTDCADIESCKCTIMPMRRTNRIP